MRCVKKLLNLVAGAAEAHGIGQHKVVISATGYEAYAVLGQGIGQNGSVFHDLALIRLKFLAHRFLEADGLAGNYVHERSALGSGEHCAVYLLFKLILAQDYCTARPSEGLVGRACNNVGIGYGAGVNAGCDKAADMRHIDHEVCSDLVGYLTHFLKVNYAGISACACYYDLRLALACYLHCLLVVDRLCFGIDAIETCIKILAGDRRLRAVRQVSSVAEIHAEYRIAGL